jgi:DNA modification methylase
MSKDNPEAFETFEFDLPPIRGFPELRWAGKRPFKSTQYFPAQKKESYGDPTDGWWNRIYWGDNLQVMSHLLREFRGEIDFIYIDPPFDSKADYKKKISLNGSSAENDHTSFEEIQYSDLWNNDGYIQFMYERLTIASQLLKPSGFIAVHIDWKKVHHIRVIMDEIFAPSNFRNEIIWAYPGREMHIDNKFNAKHDNILLYGVTDAAKIRMANVAIPYDRDERIKSLRRKIHTDEEGKEWVWETRGQAAGQEPYKRYLDEIMEDGRALNDVWSDIQFLRGNDPRKTGYPTEKPQPLLERLILATTPDEGLVFDFFMGSGTTQAAAMQTGRRFIGADINLGAVETTVTKLRAVTASIKSENGDLLDARARTKRFTGFEVYNVNNYDLFRNPVEAKGLIREAMELQPLPPSSAFDGQREGYLVKIMPVNRIATRQDLNEVINGLDFKAFERRQAEAPNKPVERIHLVCMGHEPDLGPALQKEAKPFYIEVMVTDLIRDKAHLHFKKASDARLAIENGELVIKGFYPMNLLQKLSLESDAVEDWRQLVESVKVDFHYDGAVLTPAIVDAPGKEELVAGRYVIPADAATIRVKITDLLSESWEGDIENG